MDLVKFAVAVIVTFRVAVRVISLLVSSQLRELRKDVNALEESNKELLQLLDKLKKSQSRANERADHHSTAVRTAGNALADTLGEKEFEQYLAENADAVERFRIQQAKRAKRKRSN